VYERIREAIVEQRYRPGERLVEQRIAEELAVSRTPVREALRRLEAEGLVTITTNRGAAVRDVDLDEVVDLYGLRARLEAYAAELAAERMQDDEVDRLAAAVDAFSAACDAVEGGDDRIDAARRLSTANSAIHAAIVAGSHHRPLQALLHRTVDIPLVFGTFRDFDADARRRSDLFHHLILDAIRQRDGVRAGQLMSEHIAQGCDAAVAALRADG
jgi:DNA-binding GntR family transcriptional regulator